MRKIITVILALALLSGTCLAESNTAAEPISPISNSAGLSLLPQMYQQNQTVLISPASLYLALSMAAAGAQGETAEELNALLETKAFDAQNMSALLQALEECGISVANAGFAAALQQLLPQYRTTLAESMQTEWFAMEDDAVTQANQWVNNKTNGMIPQLFSQLPQETALLLINALYMDAQWALPFLKESTHARTFYGTNGNTETDFMYKKAVFAYGETENAQFVQLNYEEDQLCMYIALPAEGKLESCLNQFVHQGTNWFTVEYKPGRKVQLYLPKLDISQNMSLLEYLKPQLPISTTANADFSGMTEEAVCIGDIRQAVRIQIDEQGTKAAAATAIGMVYASAPMQEETVLMCVDRPFIFSVVHKDTGAILFCGVVSNIHN